MARAGNRGPRGQRTDHGRAHGSCRSDRQPTKADDDVLGYRTSWHVTFSSVPAVGRPGDRDRRQQPHLLHPGHAGWQIPYSSRFHSRSWATPGRWALEFHVVATNVAYITQRFGGTISYSAGHVGHDKGERPERSPAKLVSSMATRIICSTVGLAGIEPAASGLSRRSTGSLSLPAGPIPSHSVLVTDRQRPPAGLSETKRDQLGPNCRDGVGTGRPT